jgi:hypothetical protein
MSTPKKTFFSLNFETWAKLDTWTYTEAFLIFLNLDPEDTEIDDTDRWHPIQSASYLDRPQVVSFDGATDAVKADETGEPPSDIYRLNRQYRDMLQVWLSGSHKERNPPRYYLAWAKEKRFSIENEEQLRAVLGVVDRGELGVRETNSLLKILGGIAKTRYKYKPNGNDSAASNIAKDLQTAGVDVHEDTIRKWLDEARRLLDRDRG